MYSKTGTLLAVLLLVLTTSVVPLKAVAQGLVEYALILIVVGVGQDEVAQIHWEPGPSRAKPQGSRIPPGTTQTFTIVVTNSGPSIAEACSPQTVSASVAVTSGVNTLNVSTVGQDLLINGEYVDVLDLCIADAKRKLYQVGVPFPRGLSNQGDADPTALKIKLQNVMVKSWSVSGDADGATRAAGTGGLDLPQKFLIFEE